MTTSIHNPKQGNAPSGIAPLKKSYRPSKKQRMVLLYAMVLFFVFGSTLSWGQLLLEPFNYTNHATNGLAVQSSNAWRIINSGDSILVSSGSLSHASLPASTGNMVSYGGSGTDYYTTFTSQTSGTVYCSYLVNISSLGTISTTGGYTVGFIDGGTSNFTARLWIRNTSAGGTTTYNLGINPGSAAANIAWASNTLSVGTTYLVVVSYQFVAGANNDIGKIWINPTTGGSEPAADQSSTNATATDATSIQRLFLRQDGTSATPGVINIDEMRVGTSWASVTPTSIPNLAITGATNHGILCTGTAGSTIQYTINNTGGVATGVTVVSNDGQFVVNGAPVSVPANGSANFNVVFTPSAGGPQTATITVTSTTPGSNSPTIGLTGDGTATVTPAVSSDPATSITSNAADINGTITTLGICPATTERGFVYSQTTINNDPLEGGSGVTKQAVAGLVSGAYGLVLTGLSSSTGYSYKAYVYDNSIYTYGSLTTFTTNAPPSSFITTSGTLSALTTTYGTASATTSFTVSGANLTDDISIEAPSGFEISDGGTFASNIILTQTGGTVNSTSIAVRLAETTPVGTYSGDIMLTSAGSNDPVVATVLSTVSPKALTVPDAVANDKVYDTNNAATITGTLSGVIAPDVVTFSGTGTFASVNVNVGPPIVVTSTSTIGGANVSNYTLTQPTGLSANITKASQGITFNPLSSKTFGDAPFALSGTATSGLTVTYASSDILVATVSGNTVTIVGAGSVDITASQTGDGNYFAATDVLQPLTVNKAVQTIIFGTIPNKLLADPAFDLHAFTTAGLPVTYASSNPAVATVIDSTVTIIGLGTDTITASQPGNANYLAALDVLRSFKVIVPPIIAWQLNGKAGNEVTTDATTTDANLNTSTLSRNAVNTSALANAFSSTFYPINETRANAISAGRGQRFTISAKPNYAVSLSTLDAKFRRSGSGPNAFIWQYSTDGTTFTDIGTDISYTVATTNGDAQTQIILSGIPALQNVLSGTTITFQLIGWGATGTGGTFAIGRSTTTNSTDYSLNFGGSTVFVQAVNTSAIAGSPYCVTATDSVEVDVPFTSNGTFTAGNVFTAQLSDAAGSFASPVDIGSISSILNNGTINAYIPAGFAAGTNYRIRVVSSNPAIIGGDNGSNLIVNLVTNTIALSHLTTAPLCFGGTDGAIDLTVQGGQSPYTYSWSNSAVTEDISTIGTGIYTVTVTDGLGCTKRDTTHVPQPLELEISTLPTDATCAGATDGSIDLTVSGGVQPYSYTWSNDFGATTFAITEDITNQPAGFYIVNVTDANGCTTGTLDIINEPAPLQITSFTPSSGASGDSVVILGSGFNPVTNVMFNTTPATFVVINDGEINATVSPGTTSGPITITALPGCSLVSNTNFTINAGLVLEVRAFIEGFYSGGTMQSPLYNSDNGYPDPTHCDSIRVELYDALDPTQLVSSNLTVLTVNGVDTLSLPDSLLGGSYYIVLKHRNSIETWSKLPVTIGNNTVYDFTATSAPRPNNPNLSLPPELELNQRRQNDNNMK